MNLSDLTGKSRKEQFAIAAKFAGVDASVLEGQWARESNRGDPRYMLSPAGARGHMGLMPATQKTWEGRLGVKIDPNNFEDSLLIAANQMRENMAATKGNVADALRMYNAGTKRENWDNAETRGYVAAIMGKQADVASKYAPQPSEKSMLDMSMEEILYGSKVMGPLPHINTATPGLPTARELAQPNVREVQGDKRQTSAIADVREREGKDNFQAAYSKAVSPWDKLDAGRKLSTITSAIVREAQRNTAEIEPGHAKWLTDNLSMVFRDAQNENEKNLLLSTGSKAEYDIALQQIKDQRENARTLSAGGGLLPDGVDQTMYMLAGGLLDPVALGGGLFVSEAMAAKGLGGITMLRGGNALGGVSALALEGAAGNVLSSAALQAAGETQTTHDYLFNAATGAILNTAMTPFHLPSGKIDTTVHDMALSDRALSKAAKADIMRQAETSLGEGASQAEIAAKATLIETERLEALHSGTRAPVGDELRLMPKTPEEAITANPDAKAGVVSEHSLDVRVAEQTELDITAEIIAQSKRINKLIPTNVKGLTRVSGWFPGGESTGMTMLKSKSEALSATAKTLVENTTGAGGRQFTAAMRLAQHERDLNGHMFNFKALADNYRRATGVHGIGDELFNASSQKEFNSKVFYEVHNRAEGVLGPHAAVDPNVAAAADMLEAGFQAANDLQTQAKTVGYARLPTSSVGYMPHRLSVEAVAKMEESPGLRKAVVGIISDQMQALNGWDKPFSDKMSVAYLERATNKQYGSYEIPVNLHEPYAASMLQDTLDAMNMSPEERTKIMGSLSRGGAGHTKSRIKFDVNQQIDDGKGGTIRLGDMFDHDVQNLYRGYTRRVAGEVALADFGIMGAKGLKTLQQAVIAEGKATPQELKALEQVSSEFLNQSFGNHRHKWMDNLSIATSAARLGMAAFNQLGDFSNATLALGVQRSLDAVFGSGRSNAEITALLKDGSAPNSLLHSIDQMTGPVGLDDYQMQRVFDTRDSQVQMYHENNVGTLEKLLRRAGDAQYILTGHRRLVAIQTRGMSEQIVRKAVEYIQFGKHDVALADMGLSQKLRDRIKANLGSIATFENGKIKSLDITAGDLTRSEMHELRSIIDRGASQIVQRTYIGETGPWAHSSLLTMLWKFRTYSLTAMEKQWSRNTMNHGHMLSFVALVGSLSWAFPIHVARVHTRTLGMNEQQKQEYLDQNLNVAAILRATMNYAGSSGLASDILDVGAGYGSAFGGEAGKEFSQSLGQGARPGGRALIGGTVAPGLGLVEDAWKGTHGDAHKLLKLLPGSNTIPAQVMFNAWDADN